MTLTTKKVFITSLIMSMLAYPRTNAWTIPTIQKRSTEGLQEPENTGEGAVMQSNLNSFQFLLPFWWNYLRPMLNVFATNTNLRQTLQKEYEYEIEQGPNEIEQGSNEIEQFTQETENEVKVGETEGNSAEENYLEVTEPFEDGETGTSDINDNAGQLNMFTPFITEHESNERTNSELPEIEAIAGNMHSEEATGNSEESGIVDDSVMQINNFNSEVENSVEHRNWEQSEEEQRRFALTGNIVGSFSNSLMELMPSLQETTEHESQSIFRTNDEADINNPFRLEQNEGGALEMKEAQPSFEDGSNSFASPWNAFSMQNTIGNQFRQEEDVGEQGDRSTGFLGGDFNSESSMMMGNIETQQDEPSSMFTSDATTFIPADPDNSDNISESFSVAPPSNFFSHNLDLQNDQDSSS